MLYAAGGFTPIGILKKYSHRLVSHNAQKHNLHILRMLEEGLGKYSGADFRQLLILAEDDPQIQRLLKLRASTPGMGTSYHVKDYSPKITFSKCAANPLPLFAMLIALFFLLTANIFAQNLNFDHTLNVGKIDTVLNANNGMNLHLKGEVTDSSFVLESLSLERKMAYEENKTISLFGTPDDTTSNKYTMNYVGEKLVLTSTDADALYKTLEIEDGKPAVVTLNSDSTVNSYDNWTTSISGNVNVTFSFTPQEPIEISEQNPIRTPYGEELEIWTATATDSTSRNWVELRTESEFKLDFYRAKNEDGTQFEKYKDTTLTDILHMYVHQGYKYDYPGHDGFMTVAGITRKASLVSAREYILSLTKKKIDGLWEVPHRFLYSSSDYLPYKGYYQASNYMNNKQYLAPSLRGPPPAAGYYDKLDFINAVYGYDYESVVTIIPGTDGSEVVGLRFIMNNELGKHTIESGKLEIGKHDKSTGYTIFLNLDNVYADVHNDKNNFRITIIRPDSLLIEDLDQRNFNYWQQTNSRANHYPVNPIGGVDEQLMQIAKLRIVPNPATEYITVMVPERTNKNEIEIYNVLGQRQGFTFLNSQNNVIDISGLTKGLYLLKYVNEYEIFIKE